MFSRIGYGLRNKQASRGQIIIMAAAFAVGLISMIGLSIDLGVAFAERRTVQNAADAGALAGAHTLTVWSTTNSSVVASTDVSAVVSKNEMSGTKSQKSSCYYVDDSNANLGACSNPIPATATGVHVKVTETHDTFFIRIIPGAPKTVSTSASATAHVQAVTLGQDAPFMACGINTTLASGGSMSLLTTTASAQPQQPSLATYMSVKIPTGSQNPVQFATTSTATPTTTATSTSTSTPTTTSSTSASYAINQAAIGQTFLLHNPQDVADCGMGSAKFKGVVDSTSQVANASKSIPAWFDFHPGTVASIRSTIHGVDGCQAGATADNCVLIVPVATNNPAPANGQFYIVKAVAFLVHQTAVNSHEGVLIGDYQVAPTGLSQWTGSNNWLPGGGGVVSVRLTS